MGERELITRAVPHLWSTQGDDEGRLFTSLNSQLFKVLLRDTGLRHRKDPAQPPYFKEVEKKIQREEMIGLAFTEPGFLPRSSGSQDHA